MTDAVGKYIAKSADAATLAFFRLAFGIVMTFSLVRFAMRGWISRLYIEPRFHFTYYGFEWVRSPGNGIYLIFLICLISAIMVAIGWKYHLSIIAFFLSFTYIELIDKTTYLNHYYFISVVAMLMAFLPANAFFSVDAAQRREIASQSVPAWTVDSLKVLVAIVYVYAGLAKINSDWLVQGMPLKIWLSNRTSLHLIGPLLHKNAVIYALGWVGMLYDLCIPFVLMYKRTRLPAFVLVIVFHALTKILFPIGVFPYVMVIAALIFFSGAFHRKVLETISSVFGFQYLSSDNANVYNNHSRKLSMVCVAALLSIQFILPWRYLLYSGELFWTEEGYRFSWRVMLMEKTGYTNFVVRDAASGREIHVRNRDFLTPFQESQMASQPDFIVQYAHILHDFYKQQGISKPQVFAQSYVALNGRLSRAFIDPHIDLSKQNDSFRHKTWILPLHDTIKGL